MSLCRAWAVSPVLVAIAIASGCHDATVHRETANAIEQIVAGRSPAPYGAKVWSEVREIYERRGSEALWVDQRKNQNKAQAATEVLRNAEAHGLHAADYGEPALTADLKAIEAFNGDAVERTRRLADADVRITAGLLLLGHQVALGRGRPESLDPRWRARREAPDFVGTLSQAADGTLSTWLDTVRPQHPEYAALQKALIDLRRQQESNGDGEGDDLDVRIAQVALNLERWRWMPDDLGARHLLVNIPSYQLSVREGHHTVKNIRVIVGKPDGHETPIFSGDMATLVFSPYWNIPDRIAEGETVPALARDPDYLEHQQIDILRPSKHGTTVVDPDDVDWDDEREVKQLAFRQRPGAKNALGHVKFLFPNPYDVYLHDTPAAAPFASPKRALSHGCVRVEEPEALAQYVLRDAPEWNAARIREAMDAGVERHVKLNTSIPVHIVYFTAWVDDQGALQISPDVYAYDAKQARRTTTGADLDH